MLFFSFQLLRKRCLSNKFIDWTSHIYLRFTVQHNLHLYTLVSFKFRLRFVNRHSAQCKNPIFQYVWALLSSNQTTRWTFDTVLRISANARIRILISLRIFYQLRVNTVFTLNTHWQLQTGQLVNKCWHSIAKCHNLIMRRKCPKNNARFHDNFNWFT